MHTQKPCIENFLLGSAESSGVTDCCMDLVGGGAVVGGCHDGGGSGGGKVAK
jgi:hypothetical protein